MKNKKQPSSWKLPIIGILAFIVYYVMQMYQSLPLQLLGIDITSIATWIKVVYLILFEICLIAIMITIFNKPLKKAWKDLKQNHQQHFKQCLKYWLIAVGVMMASNLIITLINSGKLPNNEEALRQTFSVSPFYVFFSAVIFAPIVEELVFRQGVRYIFKNDLLFILISGLLFGSMHVIPSMETWIHLLYIIPYSAPGIGFAYMIAKTKNIMVPIGFHLMHNGILVSLQFLLLFLS